MKLILVDDNQMFREDIKTYLELELGYKVIAEASSGEEFLELKCIHETDLILMDINMGKTDGFRTTKKILAEYPFLKIIAVTFDIKHQFLIKIIEAGFKGFVYKGNIYETLKPTLQEVNAGKPSFPKELLKSI